MDIRELTKQSKPLVEQERGFLLHAEGHHDGASSFVAGDTVSVAICCAEIMRNLMVNKGLPRFVIFDIIDHVFSEDGEDEDAE